MSTPTYIYKIIPSSKPPSEPLPDALPVSDLDRNDGFIHLSTQVQLPGTLGRYFVNEDRVYILKIFYDNVKKDIKWEDSRGKTAGGVGEENIYPHLYNGLRVGKQEVESVQEWERGSEGWDLPVNKAKAEGWFVY